MPVRLFTFSLASTAAVSLLAVLSPFAQAQTPSPPAAAPTTPPQVTVPSGAPTPALGRTPRRPRVAYSPTETADSPLAIWVPAAKENFDAADRPHDRAIDTIVIHDIEGTAESTVHWFQNPVAKVSAHYVLDSETGRIYQQVKEHDIAYQVGNGLYNGRAIGIEHGGYAYRPGFFNRVEYEASARLVRDISRRNNVPRDRTHIIGHAEVPDPNDPTKFGGRSHHTDPGPWWDWDYFMTLVRNDARADRQDFPTTLHPGEAGTTTVTMSNLGDDEWPGRPRQTESAEAIAQRAKGLVYLGTWNEASAPLGPESAFYGSGWASPRLLAAVADVDVLPGASATFTIPFHAPLAPGTFNESFRLWRMPIAPRAPVPFGPVLNTAIKVEPWEVTVTAAQSDAFTAPGWTASVPAAGAAGTTVFWFQPKAGQKPLVGPAEWKATLPASGLWDVYVRWKPGAKRTAHAGYSVPLPATNAADGTPMPVVTGAFVVPIDQRKNGGEWHLIGRYPLSAKIPAVVQLSADQAAPGEIVVADAVRFTGPFGPLPPSDPAKSQGAGPRP